MSDKDKRGAFTTVVISDIENNTQEVVYNSYTLPLLFYNGTNMSKLIEKIEVVPDKGITIQNDIIFYDNTYEDANSTFEFVMITMHELEGTQTHSLAELIEDGFTITPFINSDGGGDSDLTTATVTFVMTNYAAGYVGNFGLINVENDHLTDLVVVEEASHTAEVVLYKGKAYTNNSDITSVEGNATLNDDDDVEITGDCTINFTGSGII